MDAIWRQCLFDLRRMAFWVLAHAALLAWHVAAFRNVHGFHDHDISRAGLELAMILLLGGLVLDHPLFSRRAFWRTRPLDADTLLGARWLFAAVALWMPRVLAQFACLRCFGSEHHSLTGLALLDVALAQAAWIMILLILVSLCRRPYQVALVPIVAIWPFSFLNETLQSSIERLVSSPTERLVVNCALSLFFVILCGRVLIDLYHRRCP